MLNQSEHQETLEENATHLRNGDISNQTSSEILSELKNEHTTKEILAQRINMLKDIIANLRDDLEESSISKPILKEELNKMLVLYLQECQKEHQNNTQSRQTDNLN